MITITNNSIYYTQYGFFNSDSIENAKIVNPKNIIKYLSDDVQLGESVIFKRFFDIVSYNVPLFNQIFYKSLGGYSLEPYLQEIENNKTEDCTFDYLELCWRFDNYSDDLEMFTDLQGVSNADGVNYAIDFVSLNNLKNFIVKLNTDFYLSDYTNILNNEDRKSSNIKYLGKKSFKLFDIFESIFNEISFHGGPQAKKEMFEELQEAIEESSVDFIEDDSKDYATFEEIMNEYDNNDAYLVKYKEDRSRVDKNRISNNKNLSKLKKCLLEKMKIYDEIKNTDEDLDKYYKKLTNVEYNMQLLYGEDEDISKHKFWETPKCTCPKIDNIEIFPSKNPIFSSECPIHKKTKKPL